jgi:hypothetical protein
MTFGVKSKSSIKIYTPSTFISLGKLAGLYVVNSLVNNFIFLLRGCYFVNLTELKIFWQDLVLGKLVNPTELEIFWQDFDASTERLSTVSSPFDQKTKSEKWKMKWNRH